LPPHDVEVLKILLNAEPLILDPNYDPSKGTPSVHSKLGELYLPLEGLRDVAAEKARLQKELVKIDTEIQKVEQKLNNPAFVQKVPPAVLAENQQRLADWQAKRARVEASLNSFES
jgi:valyl-tRNA synthetase